MGSVFCRIDDKHIPLYRVMWISDVPHFCGHDDCAHEAQYEIRLECEESVWANRQERDNTLAAIEAWRPVTPRMICGDAMSLFGDSQYRWRETYFVLFQQSNRPLASDVVRALTGHDGRFLVSNVREDGEARLESLTLKSPDDFAAMDVSYVTGDEVTEQIEELSREVAKTTLTDEEQERLHGLPACDARFDIFHFEQVAADGDEDDDFLDPAALLIVMERLAELCQGVAIDPQSGIFDVAVDEKIPRRSQGRDALETYREMQAKEIKPGTVVNYQGSPILIESVNVQTPSARGAATLYKFRGRNLVTKQKADIALKGSESLEQADFERRSVKFMYADATHIHLLDQTDYNQWSVGLDDVADARYHITEDLEGMLAQIYNGECVGVQIPAAVELAVTECDPGVKGNSATSRTKPATLETGLVVQVPEYISQGERIKVDTRTGQFLARAGAPRCRKN